MARSDATGIPVVTEFAAIYRAAIMCTWHRLDVPHPRKHPSPNDRRLSYPSGSTHGGVTPRSRLSQRQFEAKDLPEIRVTLSFKTSGFCAPQSQCGRAKVADKQLPPPRCHAPRYSPARCRPAMPNRFHGESRNSVQTRENRLACRRRRKCARYGIRDP